MRAAFVYVFFTQAFSFARADAAFSCRSAGVERDLKILAVYTGVVTLALASWSVFLFTP